MSWRVLEEGDTPSLPLGLLKSALRIHHDADDQLLRHLTHVAKQYIETYAQTLLGDARLEMIINRPFGTSIALPTGPLRTVESVSYRRLRGEWTTVPLKDVQLFGHHINVTRHLVADQVRIIGRGGISPIPPLIEGIWLNVVKVLYESDTPDLSIITSLLRPLANIKHRRLA
jgi:uncharacterized phiE125 gp8 family phage protein